VDGFAGEHGKGFESESSSYKTLTKIGTIISHATNKSDWRSQTTLPVPAEM